MVGAGATACALLVGCSASWYGADAEKQSLTAWIPAAFGVVMVLASLASLRPKWRMHAMHTAALAGTIGFAVPLVMLLAKALTDWASKMQALMVLVAGAYVVFSVRSFIRTRRQQRQEKHQADQA